MSETFVYIIAPVDNEGPCKVGISDDPWGRVRALQTGSFLPLRVAEVYGFNNRSEAALVEREFHGHHASARLAGEWFDVDFEDANYFLFRTIISPQVPQWQ